MRTKALRSPKLPVRTRSGHDGATPRQRAGARGGGIRRPRGRSGGDFMRTTLLLAALATLGFAGAAMADPAPAPPAASTPSAPAMQMPAPSAVLASMDSDHDGSISLAEWTAAGHTEPQFTASDANHDSKVSLDELTTVMQAMA